jgi:starch synthase (maltosyl-transferring)
VETFVTPSRARPAKTILEEAPAVGAEAASAAAGPRIYNLFPPLAGSVSDWTQHLRRIAGMNFNWVFVNPFHATGSSGSIYAIKDPYSLSDLTLGNLPRQDEQTALRQFTTDGKRLGLRVMMDLVINHTAQDAVLPPTIRNGTGAIRMARSTPRAPSIPTIRPR